ncbi:MAG: DoxX family membrane protein [Roseiarcus sp.]|jgi:putative oxidoreductase
MQTGLLTLAARLASVPVLSDIAALAARLLVASLFVPEGWGKINGYAATQSYMVQFGVEPRLLPLVIALEFGGGLLLALGGATRPLALALGIFSLLAALIFHQGADFSEVLEFRKDFAIAGGLFALAALGAGAWSLDALFARRLTPALARGRADAVPR